MSEIKYSFKEIFDKDIQTIEIPKIQRDFAYGRTDIKTTDKRISFVNRIFDCLENDKEMELDFIYGYMDKEKNSLVPLDGQQRITILFLLHWILLPKNADKKELFDITGKKSILTYNTRFSSEDFCNALVNLKYSEIVSKFISVNKPAFLIQKEEETNNKIDSKKIMDGEITFNDLLPKSNDFTYEQKKVYDSYIKQFKQYILDLKKANTISSKIKDEDCFLWSWKDNPTVKSMLVMLDCFEDKIKGKSEDEVQKLYNNLKKLNFYFLNLDEYNMSEKLYVKMNARGKQLSDFDYYKSILDKKIYSIGDKDNSDKWRRSFDNKWMNYFWNICIKQGSEISNDNVLEVERVYIDFINKILLLYLMNDEIYNINDNQTSFKSWEDAIKVYGKLKLPDAYENEIDETSKQKVLIETVQAYLRKFYQENNDKSSKELNFVVQLGLLDRELNSGFLNFFDYFIQSIDSLFYFDKQDNKYKFVLDLATEVTLPNNFISDVLQNSTTTREVYIFIKGILLFTLKHTASEIADNEKYRSNFNEWCRFIKNLSLYGNTFCDNSKYFTKIIKVFDSWDKLEVDFTEDADLAISKLKCDSLAYFSTQFNEELTKANLKLIKEDKDIKEQSWFDLINKAEEHPYFQGQINFMLDYAKDKSNGLYDKNKFKDITQKINQIFDEKGVFENEEEPCLHMNAILIKSAMLCLDDFRLQSSCFIYEDDSKDRDRSWRALFRNDKQRQNFFNVIKDWDIKDSLQDYLNKYILNHKDDSNIEDWKKCFINNPEMFNMMEHGVMVQRFSESEDKTIPIDNNIGNLLLIKSPRIFNWNSVYQDLWLAYFSLEFKGKLLNSNENINGTCSLNINNLEIKAIFNGASQIIEYQIFKDKKPEKHFLPTQYYDVEAFIKENILENIEN